MFYKTYRKKKLKTKISQEIFMIFEIKIILIENVKLKYIKKSSNKESYFFFVFQKIKRNIFGSLVV
jgi:hypothetical protein